MKPTMLLTLCFLLFALPLAFSSNPNKFVAVLDTKGKPVFNFARYYILPAIRGAGGGGVVPGKTGNSKCPLTVLQEYSEVANGAPVIFSSQERDAGYGAIFLGVPLSIEFAEKPECAKYSDWHFVGDDFPREWAAIGGGGVHHENRPGKGVVDGSFKIEKHVGLGYKLVFCPAATTPPGVCFDIGRRDDKNGRRLILTEKGDPAFQIVFVHADADTDAPAPGPATNGVNSVLHVAADVVNAADEIN